MVKVDRCWRPHLVAWDLVVVVSFYFLYQDYNIMSYF